MVHDKHNFFEHYRLPAFPSREWLSDLFFGEQVQISQASLLPVLSTDALRKMRNVKFLQLNYMKFYGSYEHFPKNVIWLCWHGFSLRSIPKHLCLEKLVVLDLSRSCLVDAWKGKMVFSKKSSQIYSATLLDETRFKWNSNSTLPQLPSNLFSLDVSSSYSLQSVPNLIPWTVVYDCDQLADIQDWVKLELIQKADSHMFRILESVNAQIQPWNFQVTVVKGVFNVVVSDEDGMCKFYEEEEEEWIIQKEFVGHLSFQIASPAAHRICAFNLFTRFCTPPETLLCGSVYLEIRNNTSGRSLFCPASFFPSGYKHGNAVFQSLSHWKLGGDDPTFDNGDDVSISVLPLDPTIQIMTVGILLLHEEEGNGVDDKIQSFNKVVTSQCSSSSNREGIATHNNSDDDDVVYLANVEIASRVFRIYSCDARYNPGNLEVYAFHAPPQWPFPPAESL
ncbi:TOLL/INTERLEUKIN-1 RECEPTOR (TIR) DOMAIN-CONTAINING PROTEIN-RELATED [Salix viminalis]|uniref:TOLL/INTERLEUKIN-1 RECEPTOR (TIR) DOMAIN-CONTAINING PROTEIN-RELATED n=1 Tax=Salix viminalis TaxID=40686 RepID=A0A9Q0U866_SALVM|nr:TOLL/INTERLEUKIN-1 RECEPTOR (TIR) DOMAIN-CONTAINING PROTEIN-RELATED [Salix viminalis]